MDKLGSYTGGISNVGGDLDKIVAVDPKAILSFIKFIHACR
jgi:hypothetical protein